MASVENSVCACKRVIGCLAGILFPVDCSSGRKEIICCRTVANKWGLTIKNEILYEESICCEDSEKAGRGLRGLLWLQTRKH